MKKIGITFLAIAAVAFLIIFYFVPAFRGDIAVVAGFHLGPVYIRFYGLLLASAILAAFFVAARFAKHRGIDPMLIEQLLPWLVVGGFVGARLYFVIFSWEYFADNWLEILQIWKGGFSIYGGIIGSVIAMWIFARRQGLDVFGIFDIAALVMPLAQSIGRFGNFFNQEAFGTPTDLPWKMYIAPALRPDEYLTQKFFHPAFLYEALWDAVVFAILWKLSTRTGGKKSGYLFGMFLILYSLGRFFVESVRLDSFFVAGFRVDQAVALTAALAGVLIIYMGKDDQAAA